MLQNNEQKALKWWDNLVEVITEYKQKNWNDTFEFDFFIWLLSILKSSKPVSQIVSDPHTRTMIIQIFYQCLFSNDEWIIKVINSRDELYGNGKLKQL